MSEEYKGFYALFYLKKRSKPRLNLSDPVLRYYRWVLVLVNTTWSEVEKRLSTWRPLGKRSTTFKELLRDGAVDLILPAHPPEYYVSFADRMGCRVEWREKRVTVDNKKTVVKVPVIEFDSDVKEHMFATYSAALITFKNPSIWAPRLASKVINISRWADWLGIMVITDFDDVRNPNYLFNGYKYVMRVGKAFVILAALRRRTWA